jgi:hypothetical protein
LRDLLKKVKAAWIAHSFANKLSQHVLPHCTKVLGIGGGVDSVGSTYTQGKTFRFTNNSKHSDL